MLSLHSLVLRLSAWARSGVFFVREAYWISWAGAVEPWSKYMTRQTSKHNGTFQTKKSNDLYNTWNAIGPFRATQTERVLQAISHSPVRCCERLRIRGRDGFDSPKTRRRRWLWREGLSKQIAMRMTQISLIVSRRRRWSLCSRKGPSQRYVDINW